MPRLSPVRAAGALFVLIGLSLLSISGIGLYGEIRATRAQVNVIPPFTATPAETATPTTIPTLTLAPIPKPKHTLSPGEALARDLWEVVQCDCQADLYDCEDFETPFLMLLCHSQCLEETGTDIHRLDENRDGKPCDTSSLWPTSRPATPAPTETPSPAPSGPLMVIKWVNTGKEYVDLANEGNQTQDLAGWVLLSQRGAQSCELRGGDRSRRDPASLGDGRGPQRRGLLLRLRVAHLEQ